MSPNMLPIAFALLTTGLSFAEARLRTTTGSRTGSSLAKGALIAIVVCVVIGVAILALCCFCAFRIMKGRKAKNAGTAPAVDKPVDYGNQNYGQQAPYNNAGGYENNPGGYNGQYGGGQYATHQGEYNAGYNTGTGGYPPPTTYAPPPGAPNMPIPGTGQY